MPEMRAGVWATGKKLLAGAVKMRRQPNLRRLVRRRSFRQLRAVSAQWLDRHFELIEASAPRLERVGAEQWDWCAGSARWRGFAPGFPASAGCGRSVTVVYGFDGPLMAMLDVLGEALLAAGWGGIKNERAGYGPIRQSWVALTGEELIEGVASDSGEHIKRSVHPQWRPNSALSRPTDMEATPPWDRVPLSPRMLVWCVSRGQERRAEAADHLERARRAPRNYLLLETSDVQQRALEDRALAACEHAVTVQISLDYYSNPNARARPHRIPRYWLPTRPHW
jgi:hypothetical protein